jgi:hypothetical protein
MPATEVMMLYIQFYKTRRNRNTYPCLNRSSVRSPPKSMFGIASNDELEDAAAWLRCSGGMNSWAGGLR